MPVKKSKPRTATTERRIKKYAETYRSKTVPLWFKKVMPEGAALLEEWLTNQDELEKQIFAQLDADGISGEQQVYYAAFARRLFSTCLRFYDATYAKEKESLKTEFTLRGLDPSELETIIDIVDDKCKVVRGIVVTLQDIEDKLDNATWGLAALKALIDDLEAKLDDGTHGLSALKTLIDALEAKLDDASHGLAALKALIDSVEDKLDDPSHGLASLKTLIDAVEAKLDDATHGLSALHTDIAALETKLDDATYGLSALHTDITSIENKLDNGSYGLSALKTLIDAVEAKLDNATYGLNALKTLIDSVNTRLDNATYGLNALHTHLTNIENYVDEVESLLKNATYGLSALHDHLELILINLGDANYGLSALHTHLETLITNLGRKICCVTFLSVIDDVIDLPAAATDTNLPDVVISGIPAGATLDKVLVFVIIRAIENTNAGGSNAIEGAQNIRIKKSTGAWGVDDIIAIPLTDNMWTVAASTREFGDVIGGDDAHDVKSEVDGNATYNLRFEDANVDYDYLRLNDVQVMIKVWYH